MSDVNGKWRTIRGRRTFINDTSGEASISKAEFEKHHAGYQPDERSNGLKIASIGKLDVSQVVKGNPGIQRRPVRHSPPATVAAQIHAASKNEASVINAILNNKRKDSSINLRDVQEGLRSGKYTPQQVHDIELGIKLNTLLENKGPDEAKTTAKAFQAIADANSNGGQFDQEGFKRDVAKFMIDQKSYDAKNNFLPKSLITKALHGVGGSPVAEATFGRERIGTQGWHPSLREGNNNQTHHFAMYALSGMQYPPGVGRKEVRIDDGDNPIDIRLGDVGVDFGRKLRNGSIPPKQVGVYVYHMITHPQY